MALREVLAFFQVKVEGQQELLEANRQMARLMATANRLGDALKGGVILAGIRSFVNNTVDMATETDRTAKILGVTTTELQAFHLAAELSNTSVESVDTALRFLNRSISGLGAKKGSEELAALGVKTHDAAGKSRPVIDVFADLADVVASAGDEAKATGIAMTVLGRGGAQALPLLLKGGEALRKKFAELQKLGGGLSPEMIERSRELQQQQARLHEVITSFTSSLALGFLPAMTETIEKITDFGAKALTAARKTTVFSSLPIFLKAAGMAAGIYGLTKAFGALATMLNVSFPELLAISAAVTALYVVFDDLFALFTGKSSLIGRVLDDMFGVGASTEWVKDLKNEWKKVLELFGSSDADASTLFIRAMHDAAAALILTLNTLIALWKTAQHLGAIIAQPFVSNKYGLAPENTVSKAEVDRRRDLERQRQDRNNPLSQLTPDEFYKKMAEGQIGVNKADLDTGDNTSFADIWADAYHTQASNAAAKDAARAREAKRAEDERNRAFSGSTSSSASFQEFGGTPPTSTVSNSSIVQHATVNITVNGNADPDKIGEATKRGLREAHGAAGGV